MPRVTCFALLAFAVLAAGCNSPGAPRPTGYPVKGKVVRADGSAVGYGRVYFTPNGAGAEEWVVLKQDGSFEIPESKGGVLPGNYIVTYEGGAGLPAKYYKVQTSDWKVEVKSDLVTNVFELKVQ
jgi:hypothetical protein